MASEIERTLTSFDVKECFTPDLELADSAQELLVSDGEVFSQPESFAAGAVGNPYHDKLGRWASGPGGGKAAKPAKARSPLEQQVQDLLEKAGIAGNTKPKPVGLSDEEVRAVEEFSGETVFNSLNGRLREGRPLGRELTELSKYLDRAIDKCPRGPTLVWRGEYRAGNAKDVAAQFKPGQKFTTAAYFSTSSNEGVALDFSGASHGGLKSMKKLGQTALIYELPGEAGGDISGLSDVDNEDEVLFKPKTKFTVVSSTVSNEGLVRVKLK